MISNNHTFNGDFIVGISPGGVFPFEKADLSSIVLGLLGVRFEDGVVSPWDLGSPSPPVFRGLMVEGRSGRGPNLTGHGGWIFGV